MLFLLVNTIEKGYPLTFEFTFSEILFVRLSLSLANENQ